MKREDGTVASLTMAEYVWRVVAAEMPASFEPEALKAQAVTARTYTLYKMKNGPVSNHPDADVCTDITCCQAYIDPAKAAANWGTPRQSTPPRSPTPSRPPTDRPSSTGGAHRRRVLLLGGGPDPGRGGGVGQRRALPHRRGQPRGRRGAGLPQHGPDPLAEFKETFLAQHPDADLSGEASGWFGPDADPLTVGAWR